MFSRQNLCKDGETLAEQSKQQTEYIDINDKSFHIENSSRTFSGAGRASTSTRLPFDL